MRPAAPMSWIRDDRVRRHQREAGLHQQLLCEGVADLYGRPLLLGALAEGGRCHGGTVDAVAPGLGADIHDRMADRVLGSRVEDAVRQRHAHGHGVDQDVAVVGRIEGAGAAHRWARRCSCRSRRYRRPRPPLGAGSWGWPGAPKRSASRLATGRAPMVNTSRRDATDPRRSPLIGLDEGRVIVALHLEDRRLPVADIHHAGVLPRPADDPGRPRSAACAATRGTTCRRQCSFHIAEKMPSSVRLGARPMTRSMRAYSSALSPCSATSAGVIGTSGIARTAPLTRAPPPADRTWRARRHRQARAPRRARDAASGPAPSAPD